MLNKQAMSRKDFPRGRERKEIGTMWHNLQAIHSETDWTTAFNDFYVRYKDRSETFRNKVQVIYRNKIKFAKPYIYKKFNIGFENIEPSGKRNIKLMVRQLTRNGKFQDLFFKIFKEADEKK